MRCETCHEPCSENGFSYTDRMVRHDRCREQTPYLECDMCGEAAFADDWSDMAGMFVCEACVEAAIAQHKLEQRL